jgi:AraC-like DNA-binding protein
MDKELSTDYDVRLYNTRLDAYVEEPTVVNQGAIVLTRSGEATLTVNFKSWEMPANSVIVLFPGDVMKVEKSADFVAEVLSYDAAMLREASLQIETVVYQYLRVDRCRGNQPVVSGLVNNIFGLLGYFFSQPGCTCIDEVVLYQLKTFFIGFYDFLRRNPRKQPREEGSRRVNELFSELMRLVAAHYMESRDVAYYAGRLNITTKYLAQIVNKKTGHTPKVIIDHYVIMQLKMLLRTSHESIKQISWRYHFNDDSFFCRYFKLHTGLTPQQYRKKITEN